LGETPLLPVQEARQRLLSHFHPKDSVLVPLDQCAGRVLAQPVVSALDLPPFPNSSMDGFAVRSADIASAQPDSPSTLKVVGDAPAGNVVDLVLQPGQAVRIMTGAPLVQGADAVLPVEDTDFNYRQPGVPAPEQVLALRPVSAGDNIRPAGQDVRRGETVLQPGKRLRPQDLGMLAMMGMAQVPVYARPRVAIFSTGDELVPVDQPLAPGKIHDANTYTLVALVESVGAEAVPLGIARDREDEVQAVLDRAVEQGVDLILSSAGVSVGAFDFVRMVVEEHGHLEFWKLDMRPGKPLTFGQYRDVPFVGLPGNPVAAYVGFQVFVHPALSKLGGTGGVERTERRVVLQEPIESDGRESYLRAVVKEQDGRLLASLTGHQGSGNLRSLVQANAFLFVPSGVKSLRAGAEATAWLFGDLA
jgi:molybdopterin molybdotransferase